MPFTKELTAKDIEVFNKLNRLVKMNYPKWYINRRKDELFGESSYVSPVDFWNDYLEWCKGGEQLKLF